MTTPDSKSPQAPEPGKSTRWRRPSLGSLAATLGPLLALVAVVAVFAIADEFYSKEPTFLSVRNLRTIAVQASTVAVAALGMTMIIIAGGIDLSAGTALALSATVIAYCLRENYGPAVAVAAGLATGGLAGLINGALVSLLRVVPFIVTLGTMTIYLGIGKMVADDKTVRPLPAQVPEWIPSLVTPRPSPEWLLNWDTGIGTLQIPNFASGVWLALGLSAALAAVLRYTVFGRYVFALGSNEATARLCGINVTRTKTLVYALAGVFVGTAGLYQFARLQTGSPTSGAGLELKIIAAVVIGGGSLSGGQGSVLGTLAGAAIMVVIASGCTILERPNNWQDIILGVIIVAAVTLDQFRQRRMAR